MATFDFTVLNYIYGHFQSTALDFLMPIITTLGNAGLIWIALALILLISRQTRWVGAAILLALFFDAILCNLILKPLIARIRPFDVNTAVHLLVKPPQDFSFPSGHTTASFAATFALYFSRRRLWVPAFVLACLISFSRLYLYLHYPTDVAAGILIGVAIGYVGFKSAAYLEARWHGKSAIQ
ncbi:Undecaprenyl-diphosphatase BcrC [bioreactor metagenome]|uniref:Undecaprenyl-diphosphatase BcrC n=1 Tax=bioreactor metagenome TaxID=1076179 RepID=A0A645BJJ7_9ZZZZ